MRLSFIIPVYNVAPYLRMCVGSLLSQDFKDFEIILVEDGSTDDSGTICDDYARMFDNICVIHQKNRGLSAARNAGLSIAQGDYICFVDSDDYWRPNVLAGLMEQIERDKLDVLRFRYQNVNEVGEIVHPYKSDPANDNNYSESVTDGVSFLNSRMNTQCYAVMFVIKRNLIIGDRRLEIGDCLFTEGIYFEDTDWTPRMLCRAKRVASTNTIVYNYLIRKGSITNAINRDKQKKVLDDKIRLITALQKQAVELHKSGRYNRWYYGMIAETVISIIGMLSVEFYSEKDKYLRQLCTLDVYPIYSRSMKARLINLSPRLAVQLLHLKNK